MKTLIMTSSKFTGQVIFEYNELGKLESMTVQAELNEKQENSLGYYMPWNISDIDALRAAANHATFTFQDREITFDMFWNRYDDKSRSSKKKTKQLWDKMSQAEQVKAYLYIPVYLRNKGTADKKYATTYLNDELWNN